MTGEFLQQGATPGRTAAVEHAYDSESHVESRWQNAATFHLGPLVIDETVYVLAENDADDEGYDNTISGYDIETGRGVCRIPVPESCRCQEMVSDGRLLYVYTERAVTAIDPRAQRVRWTREYADEPAYAVGSLVTADDTVYATGISKNMMGAVYDSSVWNSTIVRMDTSDGTGGEQRFREVEQEARLHAAAESWLAYAEGLLFFALDNHLYAVDPSGGPEYLWKHPIPGFDGAFNCRISRQGIAADASRVYVGPSKVDAGRESVTGDVLPGGERLQAAVAAYDHRTGTMQWSTPLSDAGVSAIATADDVVVVYESSGSLVALAGSDGHRIWEYHDAGSRPVIAGTTVYTAHATADSVVGVDLATGDETHHYDLPDDARMACPLDGTIITAGPDTLGCVTVEATGGTATTSDARSGEPQGSGSERSAAGDAGSECPGCGATVTPDMEFCSACGTELSDEEVCPGCGDALSGEEAFCPACGTDLRARSQCPSCGEELSGNEAFCPSCGTNVDDR
jgi:outer membrane protein assembly factor BamB/uncharacterized OB-fold protein